MAVQPLDQWPEWRESLISHLRKLDIPGDLIGDILLEVEMHIRESGEDPETAFGDAQAYAASRADAIPASSAVEDDTHDRSMLLIALGAFAGSALYATGAQAIGAGDDALFGLNGWIAFALGAAIVFIGLWRLPADLVRHPETNEPMLGDMQSARLILAMILIIVGAVFYFLGRIFGA